MTIYCLTLGWAACIVLCFIGWGWALLQLAGICQFPAGEPRTRPGIGLHAGIGMSFAIFLGGLLNLFHVCGLVAIFAIVGIGVVLCGCRFATREPKIARFKSAPCETENQARLTWIFACATAMVMIVSVSWPEYGSMNDDQAGYLLLAEKMVKAGSAMEPFSLRRLGSLGGQTFLHAMVLAASNERYTNVVDMAFGQGITLLLLLGFFRRNLALWWQGALVALVVLLLPMPRNNMGSYWTSVAILLTLAALLETVAEGDTDGSAASVRSAALVGLVLMAFASLRGNCQAGAFLGLIVISVIAMFPRGAGRRGAIAGKFQVHFPLSLRSPDDRERGFGQSTAIVAGRPGDIAAMWLAALVAIAPWSISQYQSSASFLYPLMKGYDRETGLFNGHISLLSRIHLLGIVHSHYKTLLVLEIPMALLLLANWRSNATLVLVVVGVGCALLTAVAMPKSLPKDIFRYVVPLVLASSLGCLVMAVDRRQRSKQPFFTSLSSGLACAWCGLALAVFALMGFGQVRGAWHALRLISTGGSPAVVTPEMISEYRQLQRAASPGSTILSATQFPYLFDQTRNVIDNVDVVGIASPPPGLPMHQGPEALEKYLIGVGINYVAYHDFDVPRGYLYSRELWKQHAAEPGLDSKLAPHFLDFFSNVETLARTRRCITQKNGLHLVELGKTP